MAVKQDNENNFVVTDEVQHTSLKYNARWFPAHQGSNTEVLNLENCLQILRIFSIDFYFIE